MRQSHGQLSYNEDRSGHHKISTLLFFQRVIWIIDLRLSSLRQPWPQRRHRERFTRFFVIQATPLPRGYPDMAAEGSTEVSLIAESAFQRNVR
jgi:hypothetical protein